MADYSLPSDMKMGETTEQYEKRKIRSGLRRLADAQRKFPKTGLIIPGEETEEDKIRKEADKIYNQRHAKTSKKTADLFVKYVMRNLQSDK